MTDDKLTEWLIYLVPISGILYRSWQAPATYLGAEFWVLAVPFELFAAVAAISAGVLIYWCAGRVRAWAEGRLPVAHTLYVLSHVVMFAAGYILIEDVTFGWLTLSLWHSAQYILFV